MNRYILIMLSSALAGAMAALVVMSLFGKRVRAWQGKIINRTFFAGIAIAVASGLLYSVVHEFGHVIFALLLGGKVRSVTWTIFSSVEPHVSYAYLPEIAGPWAYAGGFLFPTLIAFLLAGVWLIFAHRCSSLCRLFLVVPAIIFLVCNIGCLFELFTAGAHMAPLASYYGMGKVGECALALILALVSLGVCAAMIWRWRRVQRAAQRAANPTAEGD